MPLSPKHFRGALSKVRAVEEVDPLAQAIAARMIGQLNAIPEATGLGALSKLNLPAAYAGDQRSLQAVQRGISEAETGLASPGRRKMLKQGAAMAARSAVPDTLTDVVGSGVLKKALTDATSPTEYMEYDNIHDALAAVTERINTYNAGVKQQTEEGALALLRMLHPDSGKTYDTGLGGIYAAARKALPKITKEQRGARKAEVATRRALAEERQDLVSNGGDPARIAEIERIIFAPWESFSSDIDGRLRAAVATHPKTTLRTGFKELPTLEQTYIPGVGHYVRTPLDNNPYWIKAPTGPLHDDVLIHELLNTRAKYD